MAEGFKIATAFVTVEPDTEGFKEKLEAALKEATEGADANAKVGLDTTESMRRPTRPRKKSPRSARWSRRPRRASTPMSW